MKNKRIVVAMSGGVDSSVCAAMLKDSGNEIIGITIQLWPRETEGDKPLCCGLDAIETARRVSDHIGIKHYVIDMRDVFKEKVIEDFCREYGQGRTPNPCVRCNQYIKFDIFLKKALALGADYISTGHYARIFFDNERKRYVVKKGLREKNEQSYFLYTMTQEQIARTIFPLGELDKETVRAYAKNKGLVNSGRKKSQEICFIDNNDYRSFLSENAGIEIKSGQIVNADGEVIGRHNGLAFYTVGQREGLGISYKNPLYVIKIDRENNKLIVGPGSDLYNSRCEVTDANIMLYENIEKPIEANVKIRYQHKPSPAKITPADRNRFNVVFDEPQRAITPGQAAVFYDGDIVIGGGTIDKVT